MSLNILILGVNGFIGSHLADFILTHQKDWHIFGFDLVSDNVSEHLGHPRFTFKQGDIYAHRAWIEEHLQACDVVLPLIAIANPALYVQEPLKIFELDFEANLEIVRQCVLHKKRLIFPSTSEVYGMSADSEFHEEKTNCVLGPIHKQRWIYSCSKQLMDRIIYAYGIRDGLSYTLFRPFNWFGPRLDRLHKEKSNSARVVTQFISNIFYQGEVCLVDGGTQRRSFTYIDDGIRALVKIIQNQEGVAHQQIFNIGHPDNNVSIGDLLNHLLDLLRTYPETRLLAEKVNIRSVESQERYGVHYQDVDNRVPSIEKAREILGWEPQIDLKIGLQKTVDYYVSKYCVVQDSVACS